MFFNISVVLTSSCKGIIKKAQINKNDNIVDIKAAINQQKLVKL